ncbi:TPA: AP2 domain-containing protein [Pseudomonas aeruginosa]|uniref:AP2 domain-containing protein n=1 Tax=Pseudomonas aeruginosa TaxID=287 RepID=UPI003982EB0F|nr:HNH endonuclease [Pseudomonas aeruginosa]HCF5316083.1 HNH endonuclease [Pseudomonas aeruginosa]
MKFRGVFKHADGGFIAKIGHEGKQVYLGWFDGFEAARQARLDAEVRLFGAVFDRREIEVGEDHAKVPLHGRNGAFYGYALVDLDDLPKVAATAWTVDARGYVAGRPEGMKSSVTMHRWIIFGDAKGSGIDHRDGDKLNNRRSNLREATQGENAKNTRLAKNNSSGFKGVSRTAEGRWRARITVGRKEVRLGNFDTREEAAAAYDLAALQLHGEFASPNSDTPGVRVKVVPLLEGEQ